MQTAERTWWARPGLEVRDGRLAIAGRDAELAQLGSIVTQLTAGGTEQHVLITGLRGVGKTVLLNEFEHLAQDAGWPAETKEVGRRSSVTTLLPRPMLMK